MLRVQVVDQLTRSGQTKASERTQSYEADVHTPNSANSGLTAHKLQNIVTHVHIDNAPANQALEWWSITTNIPVVVNWADLENEGIDPDTSVNLRQRRVPANVLLQFIINQFAGEMPVITESTQWYIQVTSKSHTNRNTIVHVYNVRDLLLKVPNFNNTPYFDLNSALENTNSGGSSSGTVGAGRASSRSIFDSDQDDRGKDVKFTQRDRAEQLAYLIRDTIEPQIWQANGGLYSSVKHLDGCLVIKAPKYVHRQIGIPVVQRRHSIQSTLSRRRSLSDNGS